MNCSFPPELTEIQLLESLDSIADEAVATHLQNCSYCQTRAKTFENTQNRLKSRLYRAACPPSLELAEFHLRTLPAPHMLTVSAHVRGCPHCAREIAELGEFMGTDTVPQEPTLLEQAQVFMARLVDASPAFGALRGESREPIILEAEDITVTLDIQNESNETVSMIGQLAADDQDQWTGATVYLQGGRLQELTTTVDDLGTFVFHELTPGSVQLKIVTPAGVELQIPIIDIVA